MEESENRTNESRIESVIGLYKRVSHYRFVRWFVIIFLLFTFFHFLVWQIFTKQLLATKEPLYVGDLARIAYQLDSLQIRKTEVKLAKHHIQAPAWDGKAVDVLSIGDSFSIGGGGGLNPFYQDYIATDYDLRVMNLDRLPKLEDYMENIIIWNNSGLLDAIKPKVIVLESIERLALVRFSHEMDWEKNASLSEIYSAMKQQDRTGYPSVSMINTANYKYFIYNWMFRFSPSALNYSNAYRFELDTPMFTAKADHTLLSYDQDITSLGLVNEGNVQKMNDNLNHLADLLAKKGIRLIFMPVVDKYDLYYDHLVQKPTEKNRFFDILAPLPKRYYFVNTKSTLKELIDHDVKDVFHADDSHWSYKASEKVIGSIPFPSLIAAGE